MRPCVPALLAFAVCLPAISQAVCPTPPETTGAMVRHVVDGDTLILQDGKRLRLIGIDTPELGRDGSPDAPFASEARTALVRMVERSGRKTELLTGLEERDRYGRTLAHAYDSAGRNLNEHLLRQGLAYLNGFPPNLRFADCYREAETEARRSGRGLWRQPPLDAAALPDRGEGFQRIAGRVHSLERRKDTTLIELDGGLQLRIREQDMPHFDQAGLDSLPGQHVEIHGWLYRYRGKPSMRLRHPSAFVAPAW